MSTSDQSYRWNNKDNYLLVCLSSSSSDDVSSSPHSSFTSFMILKSVNRDVKQGVQFTQCLCPVLFPHWKVNIIFWLNFYIERQNLHPDLTSTLDGKAYILT